MSRFWQCYLYLFALYEKVTAPLVAAAQPPRKGRKVQAPPQAETFARPG